jgi:hypothetical protein
MSLNNGFYESVINKLINEEIYKIKQTKEYHAETKKIDEEEGSSILSKYMSIVINKSLNRIPNKDKMNKQIEICNKIIKLLVDELMKIIGSPKVEFRHITIRTKVYNIISP